MTAEVQSELTPDKALELLLAGNRRFVEGNTAKRDLLEQVRFGTNGQFPMAVVQGCIDSRVPLELVFDCGVGHIFGSRIAGNVVNQDQIAGMEYACAVSGTPLVLVLGHTQCGAITSALKGVELGNITSLLAKIQVATDALGHHEDVTPELVNRAVDAQVRYGVERIRRDSKILSDLEARGDIRIVGAVYDIATGKVEIQT